MPRTRNGVSRRIGPVARRLACAVTAIAAVLAAGPASAQSYAVDPVNGVDAPGGGGPGNPFKTITFALTQHVPPQKLSLSLLRGSFDAASGEVFPLVLPPDSEVLGAEFRTASVGGNVNFGSVFQVPSGSVRAVFKDVKIVGTLGRGIHALAQPPDSMLVEIEGCEIVANRDVAVANVGGICDVFMKRCLLRGGEDGVRMDASAGAVTRLLCDASSIRNVFHGINAISSDSGTFVASVVRNTAFASNGHDGVLSIVSNGGATFDRFENCVFYKAGAAFTPPFGQAIHDSVTGAGPAPFHTFWNCAFFANASEMPQYNASNYQFVTNLVQTPSLQGIGGNIGGLPLFVAPDSFDFHVNPGSAVIDAGTNSSVTTATDADGDPRIGHPSLGSPAVVDIGLDEFYARHFYFRDNPVQVGSSAAFRIVGPPGATAYVASSLSTNGNAFGQGYRLGPNFINPILVGTVGAGGTLEGSFQIPNNPSLAGLTIFEQVAFVSGSTVTYGYNVFAQSLVP